MQTKLRKTVKLFGLFLIWGFMHSAAAGPEILSKEMATPEPTLASWYRDNEWNVGAWFSHAFSGTDDDRSLADTFSNPLSPRTDDFNSNVLERPQNNFGLVRTGINFVF
jgi:hypothetical protein